MKLAPMDTFHRSPNTMAAAVGSVPSGDQVRNVAGLFASEPADLRQQRVAFVGAPHRLVPRYCRVAATYGGRPTP